MFLHMWLFPEFLLVPILVSNSLSNSLLEDLGTTWVPFKPFHALHIAVHVANAQQVVAVLRSKKEKGQKSRWIPLRDE